MSFSRELPWMVGCIAAGAFVCYMAPDYGYSPMYFFAGCFYAVTGAVRFLLHWLSDGVR